MHIFLNFHWPAFLAIQLVFGIYWNNFIHSDICLRCQSNISEPVGLLLEWWIFDFYYIGYYSGSLCCMDTESMHVKEPQMLTGTAVNHFLSHTREQRFQQHGAHLLLFGFRCLFPSWKIILISSKAVQAFPLLHRTSSSIMTFWDGTFPQRQNSWCYTINKNNWLDLLFIRIWLDPDLCLLSWCLGQTT